MSYLFYENSQKISKHKTTCFKEGLFRYISYLLQNLFNVFYVVCYFRSTLVPVTSQNFFTSTMLFTSCNEVQIVAQTVATNKVYRDKI